MSCKFQKEHCQHWTVHHKSLLDLWQKYYLSNPSGSNGEAHHAGASFLKGPSCGETSVQACVRLLIDVWKQLLCWQQDKVVLFVKKHIPYASSMQVSGTSDWCQELYGRCNQQHCKEGSDFPLYHMSPKHQGNTVNELEIWATDQYTNLCFVSPN